MSMYRVLIKTHHMTSRKKILTITKAAKRLSCSVLLKTGAPPGVMIAEGEDAGEWLDVVKASMPILSSTLKWLLGIANK